MQIAVIAALALLAAGLAILWLRERTARRGGTRAAAQELDRVSVAAEHQANRLAQAESALAASAAMLLVADRELRVSYANPAALAQLGQADDRPNLLTYSGSLDVERLAQDALETEAEGGVERILRIEQRSYLAKAVLVGEGVGLALSDVSELQRLSRARRDFIANLSHELNTPLTSLRLLVDTLVSNAGKHPELAQELAGKMAVEVDALHQMAREMLDLEAIESGRQIVRLIRVELHQLVEEVIDRMAELAERLGITIEVAIDPGLLVLADPEQAGRAVLNVLHNALKFSPDGGVIGMEAAVDSDEELVVLSIADDGPGIPPEELSRIFERFYRVRHASKSPGTGLGLAIAHHVMQAHAGRIWAENRSPPARGAIFHLAFRSA